MSPTFRSQMACATAVLAMSMAVPDAIAQAPASPGTTPPRVMMDTGSVAPPPSKSLARDRNRITRAEFDNRSFGSARDLVQTLRPSWLRGHRGVSSAALPTNRAVVYQDNMRLGGIAALAEINPAHIEALVYLSASDATARFGTNHGGGAILVETRT